MAILPSSSTPSWQARTSRCMPNPTTRMQWNLKWFACTQYAMFLCLSLFCSFAWKRLTTVLLDAAVCEIYGCFGDWREVLSSWLGNSSVLPVHGGVSSDSWNTILWVCFLERSFVLLLRSIAWAWAGWPEHITLEESANLVFAYKAVP